MSKKVVIIGSGFAALAASAFMAKAGWDVTVLEKQSTPGGRARQLKAEGFTFDMGPSWYWMPDVFERYFNQFGLKVSQLYDLKRLDPSYRIYWNDGPIDIPASYSGLQAVFDKLEPGSGARLDHFLKEAAYKYDVGIHKLVHKPGQSILEFLDWDLIKGLFRLDVFNSIRTHVASFFSNSKLKELMEFPVLFLGALPQKTPALYSLMNYADIIGGTWYPEGGFYSIVKSMYEVAVGLGVQFHFNQNVTSIQIQEGYADQVLTETDSFAADAVIAGADYHHVETTLLKPQYRSYSEKYWDKRVMAPSCIIFYIGLNKKIDNILHHSLFFDTSFEKHGKEIYETKVWPENPLFYVSATSVTDKSVAPEGCENLFILIPVAAGLTDDSEELRNHYFDMVMDRLEKHWNQSVKNAVIYKRSFAHSDFVSEYNAFKGNAYGLANTLLQTAVLKPSCRSKKVKNLFYTGQLTVPGPGVPPSLISGEVVAKELVKSFG